MDKATLKHLATHRGRSLDEVRTQNRAAFDAIARALAEERKRLLVEAVSTTSEQAAAVLAGLDVAELTTAPVTQVVSRALERVQLDEEVRAEALERAALTEELDAGPGRADGPLESYDALRPVLGRAEIVNVADRLRIREPALDALLARADGLATIDDATLGVLVDEKKMTRDEATRFGLQISLHHVAGGDAAVAEVLATTRFSTLGAPLGDVRALLDVSVDELAQALRMADAVPAGDTAERLAEEIHDRLAEQFPGDELRRGLGAPGTDWLAPRLARSAPLLEAQGEHFGAELTDADLAGLPASERPAVAGAYNDLVGLTRRYAGLGLEDVIAAGGSSPRLAEAVRDRIALLDKVVAQNPDVEFLALDYAAGSPDLQTLDLSGLATEDQRAVLSHLKTQQRLFAVAQNPQESLRLLEAGYPSAAAIATDDPERLRTRTGMAPERAAVIHARAVETLAGMSTVIGGILDVVGGTFGRLPVGNLPEDVSDALRRIEGFADLFGPQANCACRHCNSILSPAAYFVDLMYFVEQHVLSEVFTGTLAGHALNLSVRRPDLWTLDLTCENTHTLIPTLDVINEIMESYVARRRDPSIDLSDRAAVRRRVYDQTLAQTRTSFVLPFVLPVVTVDAYAELFDLTRAEVLRILGAPGDRITTAALRMAGEVRDVIVTADTGTAFLRALYRTDFTAGAGGAVSPVDVQDLLAGTGISRDDLPALLRSRFVTAAGAHTPTIRPEKRSSDSVQNDIERVTGLTVEVLDRMHRFVRLWRHTGWGVDELDLVLEQRAAGGPPPALDGQALSDVVAVRELVDRFGMPVDVACALWGAIPAREVQEGRRSLLDRLFNNRPYTLTEGMLPNDSTVFVLPAFRLTPAVGTDNTLQRLLLGLQVDDAELAALVSGLASPLGCDPTAPVEADRGFALSLDNLSLLFRHARLSRLLKRPVGDLFRLAGLAGLPDRAVRDLPGLQRLLAFDAWVRGSGLGLDDIAHVVGEPVAGFASTSGAAPAGRHPDPAALATAIVDAVAADESLLFADTVLAFVPAVTEDESREIIARNAGLFDRLPDGRLRIEKSVAPTAAIVVPAGVSAAEADLRAAIMRHHTATVLPVRLSAALGISADKLSALARMAGVDFADPAFAAALQGGPIAPLEAAIAGIGRLSVLFRDPAYRPDRLDFIRGAAGLFGIADFGSLTVRDVERITAYRRLIAPPPAEPDGIVPDPEAVEDALTSFAPGSGFGGLAPERLAQALATESAVAVVLPSAVALPGDAVEALTVLAEAVRLVRRTGLDVPTLTLVSSDQPADLAAGAEALVSALARVHRREEDAAARLEPKDDRIRSLRRDALADFIVRDSAGRFGSIDDLYDYFLLDVQLQGCARTSRVVAAISSVQTYVHRILLNLEQDRRDPAAANHVHVIPDSIPADEWAWRKNYRVWEANRKVFLWPENYIEPELRDDKTPLFRTLEDQLLQQDVNEQNVLDAYGDYLSGLEEVANLEIAGTYHEFHAGTRTDILHVFGVTPDDPCLYYYWTITNLHYSRIDSDRRISYSPRTKMEVSIPVRQVTPVVHLGRLFVFWTEAQTRSENRVQGGSSDLSGYKHQVRVKFTSLRLDGRWTPPQEFAIGRRLPFQRGGIVFDYLTPRGSTTNVPTFSTRIESHQSAQEGYTLEGVHWQRVACEPMWDDRLIMNLGGYAPPIHSIAQQGVARAEVFDRTLEDVTTSESAVLRAFWEYSRRVLHVGNTSSDRRLYAPWTGPQRMEWGGWILGPSAFQNLTADIRHARAFILGQGYTTAQMNSYLQKLRLDSSGRGSALGTLRRSDPTVSGVAGAPGGAGIVVQSGADALYVLRDPATTGQWLGLRIGSRLMRDLSRLLFTRGVDGLLDISSQKAFAEGPHLVAPAAGMSVDGPEDEMDFAGPLGVYYREVFFHVPYLIAKNLNARQNHRAAQHWYHYIFDPTAGLDPGVSLAGLSDAEADQVMRDRVWRYLQFRGLTPPKLRDILTDPQAIEAYKKDPFNPHAIARLRLSAYQKSVVMNYVSNLVDWGDSLFRQFTMESVNEAGVLYAMAQDILGRRPAEIGDCGIGAVQPRTYERIRPWLERGSEFLLEVESVVWVGPRARRFKSSARGGSYVGFALPESELVAAGVARHARADTSSAVELVGAAGGGVGAGGRGGGAGVALAGNALAERMVHGAGALVAGSGARGSGGLVPHGEAAVDLVRSGGDPAPSRQLDWKRTRTAGWAEHRGNLERVVGHDGVLIDDFRGIATFGWSIVRQLGPIFCVPENRDLLDLWGRVEDRLYKIRHCLDITGERRDLALFAPEIDPRLLVRAKAQGLSLEEILDVTSGNLPPYRFLYLIDKAKQYVAAAQSFGSQLLSALEKRDVEELNNLRNTQQLNVLRMTTRLREWELRIAEDATEQLMRQKAAVEYRRDYYRELLDTDLLPWERTQQVLRHAATGFHALGALFGGTAGVVHLIPQLGSPFAMKYGGHELGSSFKGWSMMFSDTAKLLEVFAASAGLEAGFERRREGWGHQLGLAEHELRQIDKQISAAQLRVQIAERSLELQQKSIEEQEEIIEFFRDKFSNLGLYSWLSTSLQRVYRQVFNSAHAVAKLAERAYRFERNDESTPLLDATYWNSQYGGLLAGEELMADLLEMERRFLETNYRSFEVDQSFSVLQLAPDALLALRESGECEVAIPEIAFDLYYPGHYRRRIRAVRVTLPCITGPYSNVAATLTLERSFIRREPQPGAAHLVEVPLRHTRSVATSTAQNDSGVFDFSFRDERYMPFEGAGAVSTWRLSLPKSFRPFDYRTITDVVIQISYTALADGVLRQRVEDMNAALEGSLAHALTNDPMARALSLRQEFSSLFHRAMTSPAGTVVNLELDERFLPIFLRGRTVNIQRALLLLRPAEGVTGSGFAVRLNGQAIGAFSASPEFPGFQEADALPAFATGLLGQHQFAIDAGGDLSPAPPDGVAIDPDSLQDLLLYVEVTL